MSTSDAPNNGQAGNGKSAGLGLSFSGGGYRAAAYSMGTLSLLQDLGLMGKVKVMSGVSGGSLAVGAYLCGKAGAQPDDESTFNFYDKVYNPLIAELAAENLSSQFVKPRAILQGKKIILDAAEHTNAFMGRLLGRGQKAELGNALITSMLAKKNLSPDYVFFNTTNISSLDLFRFGIQKSSDNKPVFALNRYFLTADATSEQADHLYQQAMKIPIGHSIASSYAFPFGFEPLIFPNDFFPAPRPKEKYPMSGSLICDNKPYLAFLDGGLYDNLGLASVEDIRLFLNRLANSDNPGNSDRQNDSAYAIRYVIATDVDNIQPSVSAYKDKAIDQEALASQQKTSNSSKDEARGLSRTNPENNYRAYRARLSWCKTAINTSGISLFIAGVFLLILFVKDVLSMGGQAQLGVIGIAAILALIAFFLLAGTLFLILTIRGLKIAPRPPLNDRDPGGLLNLIKNRISSVMTGLGIKGSNHGQHSWTQFLGLNEGSFDPSSGDLNLGSIALQFLWELVWSSSPGDAIKASRTSLVDRRLGQLLPAFNGYLKRTRSLTYGFLQQSYEQTQHDPTLEPCSLIRNMIFELLPGPDADPDYTAKLITLPIKQFDEQSKQERIPPIRRKLRHARFIQDLLLAQATIRPGQRPWGPEHGPNAASDTSTNQVDQPGCNEAFASNLFAFLIDEDLGEGQGESLSDNAIKSFFDQCRAEISTSATDDPRANLHPLREAAQGRDERLLAAKTDLKLKDAAIIWQWLNEALACSGMNQGGANSQPGVISSTIQDLVKEVKGHLERVRKSIPEPIVNNRKPSLLATGDSCQSESWIPLICEMATNLNTTLWLSGYRWYVLNTIVDGRIIETGGWYSYDPSDQREKGRIVFDFGPTRANQDNPALAITILAGYISMAFNLLDFYYACLGGSAKSAARMAIALWIYLDRPEAPSPDSPELKWVEQHPYWLRRKVYEHLDRLNRQKVIPASSLELLRPSLRSRDGYPDDRNV